VVAGHLGAEVTHGEGFLTEPVRKHWQARAVQIDHPDSAVIFRDVIQPILNEKCLNCHNSNRAKKNLVLSDYERIMKGGETSGTVVAGNAAESLLYKYAMLPMDDSLHMPPKDKLQLEQEEIKLIGWWINSGARAHDQYAELPKVDSIHPIMLARFQPRTGLDLINIPFADQQKIKELNTPYRTVQQISTSKPYIAVFLGSKKDFSGQDLRDLKPVGNQIVSIDLGNSQVHDEDLKYLRQFPHLQKLHLQNIPVGDDGIKELRELQHLSVLNLSGTKISSKTIEEISRWKNLSKLYLYNTGIPEESLAALQDSRPQLHLYSTRFDLSDSVYNASLTPPVCKIDSQFFRNKATVEVKLSRGKVKYYYTLDGSVPTTAAHLYTEPFKIDRSCKLNMMATMEGWTDSKVVTFPFVKAGLKSARVILETKPDEKYAGKMDTTLVDGEAGSLDRNAKEYLGFGKENFQALFELKGERSISGVTLSFLENTDKGVMAPGTVEVWGGTDRKKLVRLGSASRAAPAEKRPAFKDIFQLSFPGQPVRFIRIKATRVVSLPASYSLDKKVKPSIFVDEVAFE
jgi:hypothetical protein